MMLYLVCFQFDRPGDPHIPFLDALDAQGPNIAINDYTYLLASINTIHSVRQSLLKHLYPADQLVICHMCRDYCAGQLAPVKKEFVRKYIWPNPNPPKPPTFHYSFYGCLTAPPPQPV